MSSETPIKRSWLPATGTWKYHALLVSTALFVLGPLGGVTAAYMNFSLGFFIGGQVLAGILGSAVTFGYGADGKHGANYIQTMSASVAGMSGMAVIIQAMVWLDMPQPPAWQLVLYFMCIGFFGVGVGMLYTPILVDRMRLTFPSGLAVANILRALTDKRLLKRSIGQLGAGAGVGFAGDLAATLLKPFEALALAGNITTIGAGMIVGARITIPAIVVGAIGESMVPYLVSIHWLQEGEPFRKIFFVIALGTILGAAIVDMSVIGLGLVRRLLGRKPAVTEVAAEVEQAGRRGLSTKFVLVWTVLAGCALAGVASTVMHLPLLYVSFAIALVFIFVMVNGVSLGVSDSNPISSAFVLTVMLLAAIGSAIVGATQFANPDYQRWFGGVAFMCAAIVLVACSVGGDMQQDRSTGWRIGTNRAVQFGYQLAGIVMGAIMCVIFAKVFMTAFPELVFNQQDRTVMAAHPEAAKWQAAMTYKFVGAINAIIHPKPHITTALTIGVCIGLVTELLRKLLHASKRYRDFTTTGGKLGFSVGFVVDAFLLPTPYASSFGGFVDFGTSIWFGLGGIISSYAQTLEKSATANAATKAAKTDAEPEVPEDMSTNSLVGGGIIAGASVSALCYGIYKLISAVAG
jgi:uncharacterized oligopeptide transporter (OPT) family protein